MVERGPVGVASGWTEQRVALLKEKWLAGFSCSQIARALGGVTRNAVIGKVNRLGLAGRGHPTQPGSMPQYGGDAQAKRNPTGATGPRAPRQTAATGHGVIFKAGSIKPTVPGRGPAANHHADAPIEPLPDNVIPIPFDRLPHNGCRWPLGDPRSDAFGYCGREQAPRTAGGRRSIYCHHHQVGASNGFGRGDLKKLEGWAHMQDGTQRARAASE